jgi:multicomponent Na+:H+ antiporter subunit D
MCFLQRHIKRLLAFSTISHVGLGLCGIGLLSGGALGGVAVYVVAHGLVKAALFMCCGILLHRFRTVDEFDLHGRGRAVPLTGALFAAGGLLLADLPMSTSFLGRSVLDANAAGQGYGWLGIVGAVVAAVTGGAVLRVAGRVFLGWGASRGPDPRQARAAEERVDDTRDERDHTPPLMLVVPAVLLVAGAVVGLVPGFVDWAREAALRFADPAAYSRWVLHGATVRWPPVSVSRLSWIDFASALACVLSALGLAALGLFGRPLRSRVPRVALRAVHAVRGLNSGHIGDYIAWWTAGAGTFGAVCLLALR